MQTAAFCSGLEEAVLKCVPELSSVYAVLRKLGDSFSFTVSVAKFVKHDVEENTHDKAEMENGCVWLAVEVEEKNIKVKEGIITRTVGSARFRSL